MTKQSDDLFESILKLNNLDETRRFFRDLLTEEEIREFALRWQVAQMLSKKIPYSQIEKRTGMSSTTIARVSRWFNKGMGGYKLLITKINSLHHHRR